MKKEFIYFDNTHIKTVAIFAVKFDELPENKFIVEVYAWDEIFWEKFDTANEARVRQEQVMKAITWKIDWEETRFWDIEVEFIKMESEKEKLKHQVVLDKILKEFGRNKNDKRIKYDDLLKEFEKAHKKWQLDEIAEALRLALKFEKVLNWFFKEFKL